MQIVNLGHKDRIVYLFLRDEHGNQQIKVDKNYYPFYYEPDEEGKYEGYRGGKYKKVICQSPWDIKKQASPKALGKDIPYLKNYLIQRCPKLTKTTIKYFFYDIETLTKDSKGFENKTDPISCISVYNSFGEEVETFYMENYRGNKKIREKQLLKDFCDFIHQESPDLMCQWGDVDWAYIITRYPNAAKHCSPVNLDAWSYDGRTPVGIAILDYMELFKKFTRNQRESYALDNILEEEFGEGKHYKEVDFSTLNDEIFLRNRSDVKDMGRLEKKHGIIDYFDEIRLLTKVFWEDLPSRIIKKDNNWVEVSNNSKIIESLALQEMNRRKIVPPDKNKNKEKQEFDGAFRETYHRGLHNNISKFDLDSCYPRMIKDFCLDSANFVDAPEENTVKIDLRDRKTNQVLRTYYVKQDPTAILPSIVDALLTLKNKIKKELEVADPKSPEFKNIKRRYDAIKNVVNSMYGVASLPSFFISDTRVSECTTFLVRDLVLDNKEKTEQAGYTIILIDTDGEMTNAPMEFVDQMNEWIQDWAKKYEIKTTSRWDCEGYYSSIFVSSKCRYIGDLVKKSGIEREVKGIELKRSDSTLFTRAFQEELLQSILDGKSEKECRNFVAKKEKEIKEVSLKEIGFPFKIRQKDYKTEPIYVRAYRNTNLFKPFELKLGYVGYYAYVKKLGYDNDNKAIDVLAYKDYDEMVAQRIDWNKMIERNITNKYKVICEAMDWDFIRTNQLTFEE